MAGEERKRVIRKPQEIVLTRPETIFYARGVSRGPGHGIEAGVGEVADAFARISRIALSLSMHVRFESHRIGSHAAEILDEVIR